MCINKEKEKSMSNVKCRIGGLIEEPAYHDHEEGSEVAFPFWPPHQGYGPKGVSK